MDEDGIAEKENKENSEAAEEAASADTEGRKAGIFGSRERYGEDRGMREDSAKEVDLTERIPARKNHNAEARN